MLIANKDLAIKYVSLHERSGYGEAARRYIAGLRNAGVKLTWSPMVQGPRWRLGYEPFTGNRVGSEFDELCNFPMDYDRVIVHTVPEYFPLWRRHEPGRRIIGYTVWETDRPPKHWIALLNEVDGLMVPCQWNREVFRANGVKTPIHVVPHIAINAGLPPRLEARARFGIRPDDYCFYSINTWTNRKAVGDTIEAFLDAFTDTDPAVLVVKTTKQDFTHRILGRFHARTETAVKRLVGRRKRPGRISLITDELDDDAMLALHAAGDCYVSLTRSEGWGIGAFDAGRFGRPVIMTGYGGQMDYLQGSGAFVVDYRVVPVRDREGKGSYTDDQQWAEPDRAHAASLMRRAFDESEAAAAAGRSLAQSLSERFGQEAVTERMLDAIGRRRDPV